MAHLEASILIVRAIFFLLFTALVTPQAWESSLVWLWIGYFTLLRHLACTLFHVVFLIKNLKVIDEERWMCFPSSISLLKDEFPLLNPETFTNKPAWSFKAWVLFSILHHIEFESIFNSTQPTEELFVLLQNSDSQSGLFLFFILFNVVCL